MTNTEIQVGEYCRTCEGYIIKCTRIVGDVIEFDNYIDQAQIVYDDEENEIVLIDFERGYEIDVIKSHSESIIDLIEEDDYVNGYRVVNVINEEPCPSGKCVDIDSAKQSEDCTLWEKDIETIVTHEQFKSMEYKVGGEDDR